MKKNSRFARILVSFIGFSSITLMSCSSANFHISLFVYSGNDTFMQSYSRQIEDTLRGKYDIKMFDGEGSQSLQNDQIVNEINNSSSRFLIVNLVDRLAAKTIIEKASTKNKPIIFINREPLENDLLNQAKVYYVGAKPESDGELQAEIVNEYFVSPSNFLTNFDRNNNGLVDVLLIKGEQGHQDTENRSQYSISSLRNLGYEVNILDSRFCDWNRQIAFNFMRDVYEDYSNDIDVILSNNDDMALGAIDYLKTLEDYDETIPLYESYFPIIGVDATTVGYEAILNKEMYGTVRNDYETQVEIIDDLIYYELNELDMSSFPYDAENVNYFRTDGIKITQENAKEFINIAENFENLAKVV